MVLFIAIIPSFLSIIYDFHDHPLSNFAGIIVLCGMFLSLLLYYCYCIVNHLTMTCITVSS